MIGTLVRYHLKWLTGARDVLAAALMTAGVVALAGLVTLHDVTPRALAASGVLWLVLGVGGLLAAARVIAAEHGSGGLRGLMLAPVDRRDLFLSRAIAVGLVVLTAGALTWVLLVAMFPGLPGLADPRLSLALLTGAVSLGALGTLAGWAALSTRAGEVVGPVLALPLAAPSLVSGLHATERLLAAVGGWEASLTFATGYAVAVGALTYIVADHVTEVP